MAISYDVITQDGVSKVVSMTATRSLEAEDLEGSFVIHITHGHIIRSLVHVVRDMLAYGIMEITPHRLSLLRLDKTERVIVSIDIDTSRFFQYFFLSKKGIIRIGINFTTLWASIKVVGKQDSFIMSKADGDSHLTLDFGNAAKQQYAIQGVTEQPNLEIPIYKSLQPNVYITVKELTKAMSYLRTERLNAKILGYKDRTIIEALGGQKVQRLGISFDDVWRKVGFGPEQLVTMLKENENLVCSLHLNDKKTEIAEFEVSQSYSKYGTPGSQPAVSVVQNHLVLKSLSKIYTIAPNSSVLATVEAGKPIKLSIPIGEYGHLTLYLLSKLWSSTSHSASGEAPEIPLPPKKKLKRKKKPVEKSEVPEE